MAKPSRRSRIAIVVASLALAMFAIWSFEARSLAFADSEPPAEPTPGAEAAARFGEAIARLEAGEVEGALELEALARRGDVGPWAGRARVRLAWDALAAGRPELTREWLIDIGGISPDLHPIAHSLLAAADVASGDDSKAAARLTAVLRSKEAPRRAEQLALEMLGDRARSAQLEPEAKRALASALVDFGSTDETRGRAAFGTLLELLRDAGDWSGYRATLRQTLLVAPLSVLRTKAIPRDPRITVDLASVVRELVPEERLARAEIFAAAGEEAPALAELGRIPKTPAATELTPLLVQTKARAIEAELLLKQKKAKDSLRVSADLDAPTTGLRDRLKLVRAQALLSSRTPAPPPKRRGRPARLAPPAVIANADRTQGEELLRALDRDDADVSVRRPALERLFRSRWEAGDLAEALELFRRKEGLFPESSVGREEIWTRAFPVFRDGYPSDALPMLDALASSADPAFARRGAYWGARALVALGRVDAAATTYAELASSPVVDFYARHASHRLAELGRTPVRRNWEFPPAENTLPRGVPPRAAALARIGLFAAALDEMPDQPSLPRTARLWRADVLARSGQRDRAMQLLKQIHPEIQTAAVAEIPERELRLFYPIDFVDSLDAASAKYGLSFSTLVGLVRQESGFRPVVRSRAGALGIMQIMPATARHLGRRMFASPVAAHRLSDPALSIEMGSFYLRDLLDRLGGEIELALAGYNCGPGRVATVKKRYPEGDVDLWVESLPFAETRDYVKKIVLYASIYEKLYPEVVNRGTPGSSGAVTGR